MGRLPDQFAGRVITYREPFAMEGVAILDSAQVGFQFPEGTFTHASDKPFEIHRMIPRVIGTDDDDIPVDCTDQCSQDFYFNFIKLRINDLGKTMEMTKSSTYLASLVKGSSETTWEFAQPAYMAKGELYQVMLDADTFPTSFSETGIDGLRVHITFEGFQLITSPASDNR